MHCHPTSLPHKPQPLPNPCNFGLGSIPENVPHTRMASRKLCCRKGSLLERPLHPEMVRSALCPLASALTSIAFSNCAMALASSLHFQSPNTGLQQAGRPRQLSQHGCPHQEPFPTLVLLCASFFLDLQNLSCYEPGVVSSSGIEDPSTKSSRPRPT